MQPPHEREPKRKEGFNWVGLIIFLVLILGPRIGQLVSQLVRSVSGGTVTIGTNALPLILGGLIVVITLLAVGQGVRNAARRSETQMPTPVPLPPAARTELPRPVALPNNRTRLPPSVQQQRRLEQRSLETRQQNLPGPPRFEPIISGKVLAFGILGLLLLGLVFGVAFLVVLFPGP